MQFALGLLLAGAGLTGCSQQEPIATYTVEKPVPATRPEKVPRLPRAKTVERAALPFEFALPEGWSQRPAGAMRLAEFVARDGAQEAVISVSTAGGNLTANIDRWRGQVGLKEPITDENLGNLIRKLKMGPLTGDYVELIGPEDAPARQTILGVIVQALGAQWFVKLQGPAELAAREKEHFEQFARSLRFRGTQGDADEQ